MKKDSEKCNNIAYHEEWQRRLGMSQGYRSWTWERIIISPKIARRNLAIKTPWF